MNLLKNISEISIKSFITELPTTLNINFKAIKETILTFFDPDSGSIKATSATITGNVSSNSITTNYLTVSKATKDGKDVTISQILNEFETLETKVDTIKDYMDTSVGYLSNAEINAYIEMYCN